MPTMRTPPTPVTAIALAVALSALAGCASMVRPKTARTPAPGAHTVAAAASITTPGPATAEAAETAVAAASAAPSGTSSGVAWQDITIQQKSPPANLWVELRSGFSLPDGNQRRVRPELAWYKNHAGFMQRTAERAKPYLYFVVQQLKERGMPLDLALLPVVESAYDPYAYSPGRAAGLWQFIASTGRLYGLEQNWWYDGRLDVEASTDAALSYLQALHDQFGGSWLLALAAYNSGSITVQRAIDYNKQRDRPTDFWDLRLPAQTRSYVPRLLAVRDLVADPQKYGVQLPFIANAPYLAEVPLKGQIDLATAAKLAGLDLKRLYLLNPGFTRWATPPNGPARLLVPADKEQTLVAALQKMPLEKIPAWTRHRISQGETLGAIARRYHTSIAELEQRNGLHGSMIRAGATLVVPTADRSFLRYAGMQQDATGGAVAAAAPAPSKIRVRRGDTLWGLAHTYHVTVAELAHWNGIRKNDRLHIGQQLVVMRDGASDAYANPAAARAEESRPSPIRRIHYVVRRGDSLSAISDRFKVSLHKLASWNSLSLSSILHPGQRLTLFVDVRKD